MWRRFDLRLHWLPPSPIADLLFYHDGYACPCAAMYFEAVYAATESIPLPSFIGRSNAAISAVQ